MSNTTQPADFDPYRVWLGIPKSEQPPNHYRLLGIVLFEEDPQVILEGADRQVAHLKNKQTGQRVALSQKLLQEVAAAAGCLLDPDTKAEYDAALKQKLTPAEPAATAVPQSVPVPMPPRPVAYVPPPMPMSPMPAGYMPVPPAPAYQPPHQTPAQYAPAFPQPLPPAPAPLRPIPVPVRAVDEEEHESPVLISSPAIGKLSGVNTRGRSGGGDVTKWLVGGGVGLLLLMVAWSVLSRPEISAGLFAERPVPARPAPKPKPAVKPATPAVIPAVVPKPGETPTTTNSAPVEPSPKEPMENGSSSSTPVPNPVPASPSVPTPMPSLPMPSPMAPATTSSETPSVSPTVPPAAKPQERTLWRYAGGFVEKDGDTWKELNPSGDYYTLTPVGNVNLTPGQLPDVLEFERPVGGRLRVYDNRLEVTDGLGATFVELTKGSWGLPAEQIELDPQPKAMMQQACQRYAEALARARKKLLIQFDQALTGNKRVGKAEEQLAVIEVLTAEKKRFEETGLVPWSAPMRAETAKYLIELGQARGPSEALFDKAANHYLTRKELDTASSILALRNKALAPQLIAKLAISDVPRTPRPMGFALPRRRDEDLPEDDGNYPQDPRTGIVRLWSNGTVNNASGKSNWTLTSTNLVLNFVRPTHTVRDTVSFTDRGEDLSGNAVFSNNYSLSFTGRVTGDLVDHERRPEVKFHSSAKEELQ